VVKPKSSDRNVSHGRSIHINSIWYNLKTPISVVVRSKTKFCSRLLAGDVGSNTAGGMDISLL